jgi:ubiquinone/menaquinone biosynthesis C-methylase UbiE
MDEYKSTAFFYDRCLTPLLKELRTDICTYIHHRGYRRIIDICCGTGDQLKLLENDAVELVGVDNSVSMLARARRNCSDAVMLQLADAEQVEFPDHHFDCGIISFSLHEKHASLRDIIYTNCRKMIRQGGSLIVSDYRTACSGVKGHLLANFLIPVIERFAGKAHYRNYLSWMRRGGLETFLQDKDENIRIISERFGDTVLCCAVSIDDEARALKKQIELLNQSLPQSRIRA